MPEPSHRTYWPSLKAAANSENVKANRSRTAGTVLTGSSVILCPAQVQSVSVTRGRSARRRSRVMLPCMDLARAAFLEVGQRADLGESRRTVGPSGPCAPALDDAPTRARTWQTFGRRADMPLVARAIVPNCGRSFIQVIWVNRVSTATEKPFTDHSPCGAGGHRVNCHH